MNFNSSPRSNAHSSSAPAEANKNWIFWIILIIAVTYGPFLGFRGIRMAGDEKGYISQTLEMAAHGNWFIQRLQDQPDYYKGPLHYILLRIGFIVFGKNPWAALYMNFFLLMGGAVSIGALIRKYCPKWTGGAIWAGAFFATCVGVYTHSFASQMETQLACLFAIALYLLDRLEKDSPGFLFWLVIGLIGWSKSPLHAALGGSAAVLYWLVSGQLLSRLKSWRCWLAVITGIVFCAAGYMPAYFFDHQNFMEIYIGRETLSKGSSGQPWTVSLVSVLGFYLLPWLLLVFVAYLESAWKVLTRAFAKDRPEIRRAMLMAISWITPSFIFFGYHPYHFENYDLPVISGVILFICLVIGNSAGRSKFFSLAYRCATVATAFIILLLPVSLTILQIHFSPMPSWWPAWMIPLSWITSLPSAAALIYYGWFRRMEKMQALAIGMVGFYISLGAVITILGERELVGIREYLKESDQTTQPVKRLGYYNFHMNIWSEWGFLNLWLDRPVYEIHKPDEMKAVLLAGETVIVPPRGPLQDFKAFAEKELPGVPLSMIPWKRWRTQGRSESGDSLWAEAWDKKDLSVLEIDYFIVKKR